MDVPGTTIEGEFESWTKLVDDLDVGFDLFQAEHQQVLQSNVSQAEKIGQLAAQLEAEIRHNDYLSEQVEDLKSKLEVEIRHNVSLCDQVEELKAKLKRQNNNNRKFSDELEGPQEAHRDEVERLKDAYQMLEDLQREVTRLSSRLETGTANVESPSKEKQRLPVELQRERTRRRQPSDEPQESQGGSTTSETEVPHQMLESLQNEFARLSTVLEDEIKKNNALTKLRETEMRHPLNHVRQQARKDENGPRNHRPDAQRYIGSNSETDSARVSSRLETEMKKNMSVSKWGVIQDGRARRDEGKRAKDKKPRFRKKKRKGTEGSDD